ncbi:hypothetical protein FRC04_004899 [Tulasnella sp. 424]|nr:hypothetical protein FRC04_004899 [Tulasnella sp. 424]KAG8975658.1 hypothetical protein FRC05_005176 [Tulasnella sp. 425]
MTSIPEEIWLQIFKLVQNVRPKATGRAVYDRMDYDRARVASVRPLSETCRAFHRICLPLLFETILIDGNFDGSGPRRLRCLADVLHRKTHLKRMVSRVYIYWRGEETEEVLDRMEGVIVGLCSVRDLWIHGAHLSKRLLGQHSRLERLVLYEVSPNPTEGPEIHSFDSLKYLRCGPYGFGDETAPFAALVVPQLETLQIDATYLISGRSYQIIQFNPAVLKKLIIDSNFRWDGTEDEGLEELLRHASRIKSLELLLHRVGPRFTLPDDTIPDLEAFTGEANHVLTFCKGRPVRDLHVKGGFKWSMTEEVPNLIRPGSVPLEHLHLGRLVWEDGTIEYIARHCPQLVSLKVIVNRGHRNGIIKTRYSMPRLRRAAFLSSPARTHWYSDDDDGSVAEKEDKLLQESREFWPQLEHLRLHPKYFWTYRDLKCGWVQVKSRAYDEGALI